MLVYCNSRITCAMTFLVNNTMLPSTIFPVSRCIWNMMSLYSRGQLTDVDIHHVRALILVCVVRWFHTGAASCGGTQLEVDWFVNSAVSNTEVESIMNGCGLAIKNYKMTGCDKKLSQFISGIIQALPWKKWENHKQPTWCQSVNSLISTRSEYTATCISDCRRGSDW
jgi:hypothetical protein